MKAFSSKSRSVVLLYGLLLFVGCTVGETSTGPGSSPPSCDDGKQNGEETGVDCGGNSCAPCENGVSCNANSDCRSDRCQRGVCRPGQPTDPAPDADTSQPGETQTETVEVPEYCRDGEHNFGETDRDCGGPDCKPCELGETCLQDRDCKSETCHRSECSPPGSKDPGEDFCKDGRLTRDETDIDCGGRDCPPCEVGKNCRENEDCLTDVCKEGTCRAATCSDNVKNQNEEGVDCGGTCEPCDSTCSGDNCSDIPPPGTVYTASQTGEVHRISPQGNRVWRYDGHDGPVLDVASDEDGFIYSVSSDGSLHKLNPSGDRVFSYNMHDESVTSVAVDGDGFIYTASADNTVHKVTSDGDRLWTYDGHEKSVQHVAVGASGEVVTSSFDNEIHRLSETGKRQWRYTEHADSVWEVVIDSEGNVYSAGHATEVHKIGSDGKNIWRYTEHESTPVNAVRGVAVDPDGNVYSAALGPSVEKNGRVHKISSGGSRIWTYKKHSDSVIDVTVDANGFVYTASSDNELHKVGSDGKTEWRYNGHDNTVRAVTVVDEYSAGYPSVFQ